jgi:ribosomal subunit interface protein
MDILVRGRNLDVSEPLREYARRRLEFAARSFEPRIERVEVLVEDMNGPRGGVDKLCVVSVFVDRIGRVFARATALDAYAAIDRAAARVRSVLVRRLQRVAARSVKKGQLNGRTDWTPPDAA